MITYRLEKGAPLSVLEIDNNFRELEQRLNALETQGLDGALTFEQQEDLLIFKRNQQPVSHVVLPKFQPIFKGAWESEMNYRIGCWVYYDYKLYACTAPHTSAVDFDFDSWQLIFDSGRAHAQI